MGHDKVEENWCKDCDRFFNTSEIQEENRKPIESHDKRKFIVEQADREEAEQGITTGRKRNRNGKHIINKKCRT